jgi:cytoskeletal protein CcmA (bactofilin family)
MSMFKKTEPLTQAQPTQRSEARNEAQPARAARSGSVATIGPSVTIRGDVLGDEDLLVEGRVEGEIKVSAHTVTIGRSGSIRADVFAKCVRVEGEVTGNLYGEEEVSIRQTGKVEGNIVAPRVSLDDGANFRGSIDMRAPSKVAASAKIDQASKSEPTRNEASKDPSKDVGKNEQKAQGPAGGGRDAASGQQRLGSAPAGTGPAAGGRAH